MSPIGFRLVKTAHFLKRDAAAAEGIGEIGIETHGLVLRLQRLGKIAQGVEDIAEVEMRQGIVGRDGDSAPQMGERLLVLAERGVRGAERCEGPRRLRFEGKHLATRFERAVE